MAISGIESSYNQIGAATNYVQEKSTAKETDRKMAEQPVRLSISNEGKEHYRNSIRQGGQESYDSVLQRREQLKNEKISRKETKAADFLKEQKARGMDKVPENLNEKMLSAVASFKEKYAAFNPNAGTACRGGWNETFLKAGSYY